MHRGLLELCRIQRIGSVARVKTSPGLKLRMRRLRAIHVQHNTGSLRPHRCSGFMAREIAALSVAQGGAYNEVQAEAVTLALMHDDVVRALSQPGDISSGWLTNPRFRSL